VSQSPAVLPPSSGLRGDQRTPSAPAWSAEDEAWIVSRYADVAEAIADPRLFSVELGAIVTEIGRRAGRPLPSVGSVMSQAPFFLNPPEHAGARRFLLAAVGGLSPRVLESWLVEIAGGLLPPAGAPGVFDAVTGYAEAIPPRFMGRLLGLQAETVEALGPAMRGVAVALDRGPSLRTYARMDGAVEAGLAALRPEVARRRRYAGLDGLSRLVAASDAEFHLQDEQIAARALFLMIAGTETTVALIGSAIKAVLDQPPARRPGPDDVAALDRAIDETLRLETPVLATWRVATVDLVVGGQAVTRNQRLLLLMGVAHRDPAVYDAPHAFDPERVGPPHLAFGRGAHGCLGGHLAKASARVALAGILRRRPSPAPVASYSWWPLRTVRRLQAFPVRFDP